MTSDPEDSDGRWHTSPFTEFELDGVACAVVAELEAQVRDALAR